MRLSAIRFQSAANRASLAACLEAIFTAAGSGETYANLYAALGMPFWVSAPRNASCMGWWMSAGHDALLGETARLFGMRLRELHPPDAAAGLEAAPEFRQHFQASYRPLMAIALDHEQPVLVRGGWPGEEGNVWGIVTAPCESDLGFAGVVPARGARLEPMVLPPVQVYVVEELSPREPTDAALVRHSLEAGVRVLRNRVDERCGIVSGLAAYAAWLTRLQGSEPCARCGPFSAKCHARLAQSIRQARRTAAAFLTRHVQALPVAPREIAQAIQDACASVVQALERSSDEQLTERLLNDPRGRPSLAEDVDGARRGDETIARLIEEFRPTHPGHGSSR